MGLFLPQRIEKYLHIILFSLIIGAVVCTDSYCQQQEKEEIIRIKSFVGTVEVKGPGSSQWRAATVGMRVRMKWDLRTYVESECELEFESGTLLKIGENSVINIGSLYYEKKSSTSNTSVKVGTGQVWSNVKKLMNKNSSFSFETPTAVAAIRGTRLGINVSKSQTIVDVFEGSVRVSSRGSRTETVVSENVRAVVTMGESKIQVLKFEEIKRAATEGGSTGAPLVDPYQSIDSTAVDTAAATGGTTPATPDSTVQDTIIAKDTTTVRDTVKSTPVPQPTDTINRSSKGESNDTLSYSSPKPATTTNTTTTTAAAPPPVMTSPPAPAPAPPQRLTLRLSQPINNSTVTKPIIMVAGVTLPGAEVTVDNVTVAVRSDGSFSYQMHIPDEKSFYAVAVTATYNNQTVSDNRMVSYTPVRQELLLDVKTPLSGQLIKTSSCVVSGQTSVGAQVEINGKQVTVAANGFFSDKILLSEQNIGEYSIEVTALDRETGKELVKTIKVIVDIHSPEINRNTPQIMLTGMGSGCIKNRSLSFYCVDKTADDKVTLTIIHNSNVETVVLSGNEQGQISLEDGKNIYKLSAIDLANNNSNIVSGEIFYLPGPLSLTLHQPQKTEIDITDLPPMPGNTGALGMTIEVEVEDGINSIPNTILYCKVNGATMASDGNYLFTGKVGLVRGRNTFLIEAADCAGNKTQQTISVTIRR
ncbi:MAG: FecR domain-containing protein [Chitinivibrionales bacterium]|nr:FecR domain-containing protein [Chitinivibrionales bacterium]